MARFLLLSIAILTAMIPSAMADDSLLSDVRIDSVYGSGSQSAKNASPKTVRVRNSGRIRELLSDAGFEPADSNDRAVKITKKLDPWSFPVFVSISEDERHLEVTLALSVVKDADSVKTETLLGLMDINRKYAPAQFLFNRTKRRTELFARLNNDGITAQSLRDEINRLAVLAKENETFWNLGGAATPDGISEKPKKSAANATDAPLTGTWSAARSGKEAFALRFGADGKFVLVYIKDGKQTRSNGQFEMKDATLVLAGEKGLRLTGTLQRTSDSQFRFQPKNSTALTFRKSEK